jgi:hypothetical protein
MDINFIKRFFFSKIRFYELFLYTLNGFFRSSLAIIIFNILLTQFNYLTSNLIGIVSAAVITGAVNIKFVFKKKINSRRSINQLLVFLIYLAISTFLLTAFVLFGISPKYAQMMTIIILFFPIYLISQYLLR